MKAIFANLFLANLLARIWAVFVVTAKRIFSHKGLILANLFGLVVSVALTMSVPLYTDSIYYRIFNEKLAIGDEATTQEEKRRPPFAFMFRYIGSWSGPVEWEDVQPVDDYLSGPGQTALGLPNQLLVRHFTTDSFRLFPAGDVSLYNLSEPLAWVKFATFSDFEQHVTLLEGNYPAVAEPRSDSVIEVLLSEALATKLGVQIGESYTIFEDTAEKVAGNTGQFPIRVAGIWKAKDPKEQYWFYNTDAFEEELIVPEESMKNRIHPYRVDEVNLALWYYVLDGTRFNISESRALLYRITAMQQRVDTLLQNTDLSVSPADKLITFDRSSRLLTLLLYAFSVPFIALILAFIALVSGLGVEVRRNEIAMVRSRGLTVAQLVGIAVAEGVFLGAVALLVGAPASEMLALVIGKTRSFLSFNPGLNLRVQLSMDALYLGVGVIGLAILMQLAPTLSAAQHTVVTYKADRARSSLRPWWQRAGLDLMLMVPTAYGAYLLSRQGSVAMVGNNVSTDPFQNPLLFLVPVLGIFSITLLFLRFLPFIMSGIAWLVSLTRSIGLLLAARHLSRSPGFYSTPLVLLTVTLSLSAFTASLAQTLDNHLYDQIYYKNGSDLSLFEFGQSNQMATMFAGASGTPTGEEPAEETSEEDAGPAWTFFPVSEHLKVDGVKHAARVGQYSAVVQAGGHAINGSFIGIDRVDFPGAAFWRRDFARDNLGILMNSLAISPNAVLAPRSFLAQYGLKVGDTARVEVKVYDRMVEMDAKVTNTIDLFPTWYPETGPLIVGNLDYLFEQAGEKFPYGVWLQTDSAANTEVLLQGFQDLDLDVVSAEDSRGQIALEQTMPNRQGLFGMLTVGFAASAVITVLSFLLYALFSFRRRFIELGVLRAIGLSAGQMTTFLASELAFLILVGAGVGTLTGIWAGKLFIPYLQVGADPSSLVPSFIVVIAWPIILRIYAMIGILFIVALSALVALLLRMKIFQAIKLGETT
jgi:putative ABC transport system permease protein